MLQILARHFCDYDICAMHIFKKYIACILPALLPWLPWPWGLGINNFCANSLQNLPDQQIWDTRLRKIIAWPVVTAYPENFLPPVQILPYLFQPDLSPQNHQQDREVPIHVVNLYLLTYPAHPHWITNRVVRPRSIVAPSNRPFLWTQNLFCDRLAQTIYLLFLKDPPRQFCKSD